MRITPDGSPSMQEYRKQILSDLVQKSNVRFTYLFNEYIWSWLTWPSRPSTIDRPHRPGLRD